VPSSGILRRAALVITDDSEESSAHETPVFTRATRRNIPEYCILNGHRRQITKSHMLRDLVSKLIPDGGKYLELCQLAL
jgi:hypothetical protein